MFEVASLPPTTGHASKILERIRVPLTMRSHPFLFQKDYGFAFFAEPAVISGLRKRTG